MLDPQSLNLTIPSWRAWQPKHIELAIEDFYGGFRFSGHAQPPGAGKSEIALGLGRMLQEMCDIHSFAIVTRTKSLQDSYLKSGKLIQIADIRGKSNYECHRNPGLSCEEAWPVCGGLKSVGCSNYKADLDHAIASPAKVTNYDFWCRVPTLAEDVGLLILDEAADADDAVCEALTVGLNGSQFKWIGAGELARIEPGEEFKALPGIMVQVNAAIDGLRGKFKRREFTKDDYKKLVIAQRLADGISRVDLVDKNWVAQSGTWKNGNHWASYTPVWAGKYAENVLFRGIERVMLMSATLRRVNFARLGVAKDKFTFKDWPAVFKATRRPVCWVRTARLNHGTMKAAWPAVMRLAEEMILTRSVKAKRKGIIHVGSYERAEWLMRDSRYKELLAFHDDASGISRAKELHAKAEGGGNNSVLVSPSVDTGHDFAHELARWQLILKIPFVQTSDPVVKARSEREPNYGMSLAMGKLVQTCGRPVRDELDWAETVIADDSVGWFMQRYQTLAPPWFQIAGPLDGLPPLMPEGGWS